MRTALEITPKDRKHRAGAVGFAIAVLILQTARHTRPRTNALPPRGTERETHLFSNQHALLRLKDQSATHYAGLYNVMKGVTLATLGAGAVSTLLGEVPPERGALLLVAFLAVVITYSGATIGQTIVHLHPSAIDVALPMALTLAELVVVGLPGFDRSPAQIPEAWIPTLGLWQILAASVVLSIAHRLQPGLYEPAAWRAVTRYRKRQYSDVKAAGIGGIATLAYWGVTRTVLNATSASDWICVSAIAVLLLAGLHNHGVTRRELKNTLLPKMD
jgi:hypothetical protein